MKIRILSILCALAVLILNLHIDQSVLAVTDRTATSPISITPKNGQELHAFYPAFIAYKPELEEYIKKLDSISFSWGRLEYNSKVILNTTKGQNGNYSFYFPQDYLKPLTFVAKSKVSAQLSIFADSKTASQILPYKAKADEAINSIMDGVNKDIDLGGTSFSFNGVVIDFEGLKDTDSKGKIVTLQGKPISEHFSKFLNNLKEKLKQYNKHLYVAVPPKIYSNGYNYKDVLKYADKVILMAHDYEPTSNLTKTEIMRYTKYTSSNSIRSLAPIKDVDVAIKDLKKAAVNSSDLNKIWLQMSFDSAQWQFSLNDPKLWGSLPGTSVGKYVNPPPLYSAIKSRIDNVDRYGTNFVKGYIKALESPYFTYFNKKTKTFNFILYENTTSVAAKINLSSANGIGGISLWSIGRIPDYNDNTGIQYNLNIWQKIKGLLKR
jgi:internalin A